MSSWYILVVWKLSTYIKIFTALSVWLSWLERHSTRQKVACLTRGTWAATQLFFFLSLLLYKHVLGWGLRKRLLYILIIFLYWKFHLNIFNDAVFLIRVQMCSKIHRYFFSLTLLNKGVHNFYWFCGGRKIIFLPLLEILLVGLIQLTWQVNRRK